MRKISPYSDYLDFGQAWLGDLPSHWQVMRTKLLFNLITDPAPVGNSEELLSIYTALGVKPRKELEARGNKASTTDNYWFVKEGDIIVNKLLAWMGAIGISEYNGVTSPAYDILRAKTNVNPYFYNFLFRNPIASREFKRHSRGIMDMRLRLYFSRFGDIKLPLPPIDEQDKIVEYVKFKLNKIDSFIRKKKQLIKLLNEQKLAIISKAVTKGLNPKAKMKPSGIEWLGDIPEHWEVRRLATFGRFSKGGGISRTELTETGVSAILYGDIYTKYTVYASEIINRISEETANNSIEIEVGDLLFTGSGETKEDIGKCIVFLGKDKTFAGGDVIIFKQRKYNSLFLSYSLNSNSAVFQKARTSKGDIIVHTYGSKLRNVYIPIPPTDEQKEITEFITVECDKLAITISTIQKEIALIHEYRTALIAESVTGKIDVRDYDIPEIQEETHDDLEEELSLVAEDTAEHQNQE